VAVSFGGVQLDAIPGFVEPRLRDEFPGLRLLWAEADGASGGSPPELGQRLKVLSNRWRGADVIAMRTQPIPHAYRSFYRQIGLDPDATRIPSEQAAVERLMHGAFRSTGTVPDSLLIALVETGVPVWALDGRCVDRDGLGIRTTVSGDRLGTTEYGHHLPAGRLAVSDARCVHALLFGTVAPGHAVTARTRRIVLFAVGVPGVPDVHMEEALWIAVEALCTGRR
jgi:DNA/RNA-binding domain of Phe-tRNA-synthetase-like protein